MVWKHNGRALGNGYPITAIVGKKGENYGLET